MKITLLKRIAAVILVCSLMICTLPTSAFAFGSAGGVIPFDVSGDFGYLRYWFKTAPEAKELPSEQFLNDRAKDLQDDVYNAGKAGTYYKIADVANKAGQYLIKEAAPKVGKFLNDAYKEAQFFVDNASPLWPKMIFDQKKSEASTFKTLAKYVPAGMQWTGKILGFGADTFFCAKGFYDMYNQPKVGFDSPFLEWMGNSFRGMSSTASLAYRLTNSKYAGLMSAGFTALDVAFNSKTMINTMNRLTKGKRIPYLDDFADWNNDLWRTAWDYYLDLYYGGDIEKNNKLAQEMARKCRGATFQGSGVGVYKPNIYLYPVDDTDVDVVFGEPQLLTVTDPPYENGWSVTAAPDGALTHRDGEYGYLFYESLTDPSLYQRTEGFTIPAEGREEAFREILRQYGLNEQETDDFCEFWCGKLDEGKDYAMYPQLTETIDSTMPVTVSPAPDTALRIWFAFAQGETPKAQGVPEPLHREGFTLVEWGGFFFE